MSRDHVVSVRLTATDHARLQARGGRLSDTVRAIIQAAWAPPLPAGESLGHIAPTFVWFDGTANDGQWPDLNTRSN